MDRKKLIKHLVFLMFFIFLANHMALKFYWYYSISWLDMLMHFLGGFWIGIFFLYVFSRKEQLLKIFALTFRVLSATLIIGVLYEFYEFFLNIVSATSFDIVDTYVDIFFNLFGSVISIFYFFKNNYAQVTK